MYRVTNITTSLQQPYASYSSHNSIGMGASAYSIPQGKQIVTLDITVEIHEEAPTIYGYQEIEDALNGLTEKIHPDAPSYFELLKKYNPEYLL